MVAGGACLARLDDGTSLMVDGAIPGETVTVELHHRRGRLWFATAVAVVVASEDRVAAPCPYVGTCGGCQLQHVAYSRQLELKRDVVADAMRRAAVRHPEIAVHGMADPWRYRWRGEFHVVRDRDTKEPVGLGFNRLRSWTPVAVDDCLIHHPRITSALPRLGQLVREAGSSSLSALHLTVGEDGAELLVAPRPAAALQAAALDRHALAGAGGEGRGDASAGLGRGRWSTTTTALRWRDHTFRVSPQSFIQVNWRQMDVLYECALRGLGDVSQRAVVDAYAGVGVLAVELASRGATVVCVESNRAAARTGVLNARLNDVAERLRYVAHPVEEVIATVAAGTDMVVVDPPRAGCDAAVTGWLALAGPARIVYVSCDPATLARDLHVLTVSGPYRVESLDLVDMFAQTHHVECCVVLARS
ncbi:MAG: class I SAM-dependent RNA methyltransferase [Candidatus Dormibacteria bacterium]